MRAINCVRPLGIAVVLLVLALTTLGVAYGLWSKVLVVHGTAETGDLDVDWSFISCAEFYGWPTKIGDGEFLGKDVGSVTGVIDSQDQQIIHVTVENGYPSYAFDCEVEFMNTGTIPVNIAGFGIIPGTELANCTLTGGTQSKTLTCDQLTIKFVDNVGVQLDPEDEVGSSLRVHVEQLAQQGATYDFDLVVCVAQWNEGATYDQCVSNPNVEGPVD